MNSITVREFDSIICNEDYSDEPGCKHLEDRKIFNELVEFVKKNSSLGEYSDALDFMRIGYRKGIKDTVSLNNYVGLIELPSGFQIEILPKIDLISDDEDRTKQIFLEMLKCLKDFQGKAFSEASLKEDRMNLYEIFINMYVKEVQTLVKHGLKAAYNKEEDNLNFYKGKLIISGHIKYNIAHKERFYVGYDDFNNNRAENRLIKSTLLKLLKKSSSTENKKEIRKLMIFFETVEHSDNFEKDFSEVCIDRNTTDYNLLMKWSKIFLYDKSFTAFSGSAEGISLLFPMEKLFEEYVARWMNNVFSPEGWFVSTQDERYSLFKDEKGHDIFNLRPDIVLEKGEKTVILDTKWKRLVNKPGKHYGITQSDMYQMYAYAKKYNTSDVWLIYPLNNELGEKMDIVFSSDDGVNVSVFFVNVANIEESLMQLKTRL